MKSIVIVSGLLGMIAAYFLGACVASPASAEQPPALRVLSSRPDSISGGDALIGVTAPLDSRWAVRLNGREITASFRPTEIGVGLRALVSGLKAGSNQIELRSRGKVRGRLTLVDHSRAGPIFSGPHQKPFVCQTVLNKLGPPLDADCAARTIVRYYYRSTLAAPADLLQTMAKSFDMFRGIVPPGFPTGYKGYDPDHPPTDVAQTLTSDGRTLPYIVRQEIGVINRAVYEIRFLHQPGQPLPNPWKRGNSGWNGRLVYLFGGGCAAGYRQGVLGQSSSEELLLARGYAAASSTLNVFGNNCNDVLSAETLSMVKEHFIESFGEPLHTIGWGESGGAMQLYLIAQNYPGLLDGIIPGKSYPDVVTWVPNMISDCPVLLRAFDQMNPSLTDEQRSAVSGFASWRLCRLVVSNPAVVVRKCDSALASDQVYEPAARPSGVRCGIYDNEISVFGRDTRNGFAARPLDNVGVEYGLNAFNEGTIDAEQFMALNREMGELDPDGSVTAARNDADPDVIRRAYRNGLVVSGGGGLGEIPILDWRPYGDDQGDAHDSVRSFVVRARLIAATGNASNQAIFIFPRLGRFDDDLFSSAADPQSSLWAQREQDLVERMDRWLGAIAADAGNGTQSEKVARNRPADLADACWTIGGKQIAGNTVFASDGECSRIYPRHADPRMAAGAPSSGDVLKCVLKPISAANYVRSLTFDQVQRLKAVFPSGVCDYRRPGVGQEVTVAPWRRF